MDVCDLHHTPLYSDGLLIATFYTDNFIKQSYIVNCTVTAVTGLGNRDSL